MKFLLDLYGRVVTFADNHGRYVLLIAAVVSFLFHPLITLGAVGGIAVYAYYANEKPKGKS